MKNLAEHFVCSPENLFKRLLPEGFFWELLGTRISQHLLRLDPSSRNQSMTRSREFAPALLNPGWITRNSPQQTQTSSTAQPRFDLEPQSWLQVFEELNDGVRELDEGVAELADGVEEFADALTEGAEEIAAEAPGEVADATLTTLVSPVSSENDSGRLDTGVNDNLTAVIIPLGLWISSLLLIVALPTPSLRALGSTVSSTRLVLRQLGPTLVMSVTQAAVALALVHTLGGVSLSALGWTLPLVFAGALAFVALHFVVWAWRPGAVVPVSLAVLVLQIATFGVLLPAQILPEIYQVVAGWGPISWFADALLGAASGDVPGRMAGVLIGLLLTSVVSLLVSRALFGARRYRVVKDYYLTGSVT
jgi:X-X-X-Leu-X-X-Gly heptad repeat protein